MNTFPFVRRKTRIPGFTFEVPKRGADNLIIFKVKRKALVIQKLIYSLHPD